MNRAEQNAARSAGDVPASALRPDLYEWSSCGQEVSPSNGAVKVVQR